MPPTEEMIEKAIACLGDTQLVHFSSDKTSLDGGESFTLSWEVSVPPNCQVAVRLNHSNVAKKGSRTIVPARSVFYRLDAVAAGLTKTLGTVEVAVDTSSCSQREIPEELVVEQVRASVDRSLAEYNADPENKDRQASKRRETSVEIVPDGIVIGVRLKAQVNNFFDPDVDMDAKIDIGMSPEGDVVAFYRSFAVDVDWPWWVTTITLGVSKIVEEFVDGIVEGQIKARVVNELRASLQAQADRVPGVVVGLDAIQDAIMVTACRPGGASVIGQIVRPIGHELELVTR